MSTNRISKYLVQDQSPLMTAAVPPGFVAIPSGLIQNHAALSTTQHLYSQAYAAALKESEQKFLAIMRSLRN